VAVIPKVMSDMAERETMEIGVITLFPQMLAAVSEYGVSGRAVDQGLVSIHRWNPRDFTEDKHNVVDDRPYGGGPGMVMKIDPLKRAIEAAKDRLGHQTSVIYLSPQGRPLDQAGVIELSRRENLILIAGRYEGVDERVLTSYVDEEWSIGDYVLSGGELAAMVVIDAVVRFLPGVLGHEMSAQEDSFVNGLLDCPHYTRPEDYHGSVVPQVLLSGDHNAIRRWRLKQALGRTWQRRPELIEQRELTKEEATLLAEFKKEQR
jgi:tRNA (guanine37-N1)-methyltransferase